MDFEKANLAQRLALIHMQDLTEGAGGYRTRRVNKLLNSIIAVLCFFSGFMLGLALGLHT